MYKGFDIILQGITGSIAYGLATPTSDIDRQGIYLAPTKSLIGIFPPQETIVRNDPDITYHELGKYVHLASRCNPTVLEQMFLDEYEIVHPAAQLLIDNRDMFLSKTIYKSYGGYAIAQAKRLNARGDSFSSDTKKRTTKHARHVLRLLPARNSAAQDRHDVDQGG
jgi:predicted nucleotidyltransferase